MSASDTASKTFLNSDFVNEDFFIDIVEHKLNITRNEFKLHSIFIAPATGKNENFASIVFRAKISIEMLETRERKLVNAFIKAIVVTMEDINQYGVFGREILMYKDVIGKLEEIWSEKAGEKIEFGPKCLKVLNEPIEVIVLEDLMAEEYVMADRKAGLNLKESKLVLAKIANFHAASAVYLQKDHPKNTELDRLDFLQNEDLNSQEQYEKESLAFSNLLSHFVSSIKSIEGLEDIAEKLQQSDMTKIMSIFIAVAEPMQNGFKVLNHGDNWVNNLMFKYDENQNVLDVKLIDFQLSFWGSPANDIIYFLVSSVADDVKTEYFDDLIQHYHDELIRSLKKLSYDQPIPTLYEIHIDLLHKGGAFQFNLMFVTLVAKNNSNRELDLAGFFDPAIDNQEALNEAFKNPIYQKALATWLPFLNKRGYLDMLLPATPVTPFMEAILAQMPTDE